MVLATLRNPRPGVSVSMQTEWGPASAASPSLLGPPGDRAVDIVTTMSKRGQTMAFLRSEVRDPRSGEAICHFMHTKFLDPGPIFRLLLTPQGRWLLEFLSQNVLPLFTKTKATRSGKEDEDINDAKTKGILDSFKITGDTSASFRVTSQHSNGFGGLHGGVQAVLMENLGRRVAKKVLSLERQQSLDPRCEKILVTYQSSASKQLKLSAFVMNSNPTEQRTTVRVVIERDNPKQKGPALLVSEGVLDFVVPTTHG
jgi:acyl-coenzyme A thioesterase PaaI-like protein